MVKNLRNGNELTRKLSVTQLGPTIIRWVVRLRAWQLVLLLIPFIFVSVTFLRTNNLGMVERRDAVLAADKSGNTDSTQQSLADLQSYVSAHMNTNMGNGVYLQYSYDKAYDSALSSAADTNNPNSAVYQQAAITCRARWKGGVASFRADYVQCVVDEVSSLAPQAQATASLPQADNFRFDFVSPIWSPDFAGLFTLLSSLIILLILVKIISYGIFRLLVRRYYKRA